jgi:hypothetical protein
MIALNMRPIPPAHRRHRDLLLAGLPPSVEGGKRVTLADERLRDLGPDEDGCGSDDERKAEGAEDESSGDRARHASSLHERWASFQAGRA